MFLILQYAFLTEALNSTSKIYNRNSDLQNKATITEENNTTPNNVNKQKTTLSNMSNRLVSCKQQDK